MKKQTIFLTINFGIIARNLLHNDFFKLLKEKYRVIIFTPLYNDSEFIKLFGGSDVVFKQLIESRPSRWRKIIGEIHKNLIYNPTIKLRKKYGVTTRQSAQRTWKTPFKFYFQHIVFGLFLSKLKFLRGWMRKLDYWLYYEDFYYEVFDKYKPKAVFISNLQSFNEVSLLRSAKKHKILSLGMTKSWDNFSNKGCREKVDKLIVWSDYMKYEAKEFQGYKEKEINVVGIPQFDIYHNIKDKYSRHDFTRIYGLDEKKKIILFGQGTFYSTPDDPYMISVIKDWIIKNNKNYQILIRPHLSRFDHDYLFNEVVDNKIVFFDNIYKKSNFNDKWDLSYDHFSRMALSLRFSDVVVACTTTFVLDTIASGNNIICYNFDKDKGLPYRDSVRRRYDSLWFKELRRDGLDKFIVGSEDALLAMIEDIIERPGLREPEIVENLILRFCYRVDGQAGQRMYKLMDKSLTD